MWQPASGGPSTLDLLAMIGEANRKIEALRKEGREMSDIVYQMWRFEESPGEGG